MSKQPWSVHSERFSSFYGQEVLGTATLSQYYELNLTENGP